MLYPNTIRNRPSPKGVHRPDVAITLKRAIPSVQAHETIERAWNLHQKRLREKRAEDMEKRWVCMRDAMEKLREMDKELYEAANEREDERKSTPEEKVDQFRILSF